MNEIAEIPALQAMVMAILLIVGAATTLIGSLGLLGLKSFYQRVHAPTLGTTVGTACISAASIVYFSTLGTRPVVHEVLILVFVTVTTPITLMILVRAAVFRDSFESEQESARRLGDQPR